MASPARVGPFYMVQQIERTFAVALATLFFVSMKGHGLFDLPYNPDGDSNGLFGTSALPSILAVYGIDFVPGSIPLDSVELYDYLIQLRGERALQQQQAAFQCGSKVLHEGYLVQNRADGGGLMACRECSPLAFCQPRQPRKQ